MPPLSPKSAFALVRDGTRKEGRKEGRKEETRHANASPLPVSNKTPGTVRALGRCSGGKGDEWIVRCLLSGQRDWTLSLVLSLIKVVGLPGLLIFPLFFFRTHTGSPSPTPFLFLFHLSYISSPVAQITSEQIETQKRRTSWECQSLTEGNVRYERKGGRKEGVKRRIAREVQSSNYTWVSLPLYPHHHK